MNIEPRHIAIIMDGNGRWAKLKGLSRTEGHRAGARAVREVVAACRKRNIPYLTLYAFSSENWNRPRQEIGALFSLLLDFLGDETEQMIRQGISLNVLGDMYGLPLPQRAALKRAIDRTACGADMRLNLAINYGGRAEIVKAVKSLVYDKIASADITEELLESRLYTAGQPDPDLLIRTSGEQRLSNFLLYQCAYSEMYFSPALWPDFSETDLEKALQWYAKRDRRFGSIHG